ncbi:hypothetical protein [Neoaquamicrobium sediminum]|uniref:hypothetical protein n=2 Tax=Neoaquamicrobium sediminum TaxID=1849104 RepID=UPI001562EB25|nr:hypothetical protein [Mesorhizobium sediminum]MBX9451735.1 hypothetical protein [Mesorhizobium sp.]NRC56064.1 hypothetical protein [Mesorhizobium sediminum]
MTTRAERLKRLVRLQQQIKALHETKHATHLSHAAAARQEANEMLEALNAASPMPGLFPDLYNRRIGAAMEREARENDRAQQEASHVATATARTNIVERAYREAFRLEEREIAEKEQLETIERKLSDPK